VRKKQRGKSTGGVEERKNWTATREYQRALKRGGDQCVAYQLKTCFGFLRIATSVGNPSRGNERVLYAGKGARRCQGGGGILLRFLFAGILAGAMIKGDGGGDHEYTDWGTLSFAVGWEGQPSAGNRKVKLFPRDTTRQGKAMANLSRPKKGEAQATSRSAF